MGPRPPHIAFSSLNLNSGSDSNISRVLISAPAAPSSVFDLNDPSGQIPERLCFLHDVKGYLRRSMVDMYPAAMERIAEDRAAFLVIDERPLNVVYAPASRPSCDNCASCGDVVPDFSVCSPHVNGCNRCVMCELCLDDWVLRGSATVPYCPGCRGPLRKPAERIGN